MMTAAGEKLKHTLGELGAGLLQLTAQQSRAALTVLTPQSCAFFLQHSAAVIPSSALLDKGAASASAPAARAKSKNRDVIHLFIDVLRLFLFLDACQVIKICNYKTTRSLLWRFVDAATCAANAGISLEGKCRTLGISYSLDFAAIFVKRISKC